MADLMLLSASPHCRMSTLAVSRSLKCRLPPGRDLGLVYTSIKVSESGLVAHPPSLPVFSLSIIRTDLLGLSFRSKFSLSSRSLCRQQVATLAWFTYRCECRME